MRKRLITFKGADRRLDWRTIRELANATGGCTVGRIVNRDGKRAISFSCR